MVASVIWKGGGKPGAGCPAALAEKRGKKRGYLFKKEAEKRQKEAK